MPYWQVIGMLRFFALSALLVMATASAEPADFPFGDFKPYTLKQLLADEAVHTERDEYSTPGSTVLHPPVRVKIVAEFTGKHRPLSASTAKFITMYSASHPGNENWGNSFEGEWQFMAEGREWWLPVQKPVADFFPAELQPGNKVELYVVYLGVAWLEKSYKDILVVEEFENLSRT
jgi:hypothetical protein